MFEGTSCTVTSFQFNISARNNHQSVEDTKQLPFSVTPSTCFTQSGCVLPFLVMVAHFFCAVAIRIRLLNMQPTCNCLSCYINNWSYNLLRKCRCRTFLTLTQHPSKRSSCKPTTCAVPKLATMGLEEQYMAKQTSSWAAASSSKSK